jgi:hypothetical protein
VSIHSQHSPSFGHQLREIRRRWVGKQLVLALSVGCTEAAVCFWEQNRRLPMSETLQRLEQFLTKTGVPVGELSTLKAAYRAAMLQRRAPGSSTLLEGAAHGL